MLAIQSGVAKYHCLYTQGALTFQTPGMFFVTNLVEIGASPIVKVRAQRRSQEFERGKSRWLFLFMRTWCLVIEPMIRLKNLLKAEPQLRGLFLWLRPCKAIKGVPKNCAALVWFLCRRYRFN